MSGVGGPGLAFETWGSCRGTPIPLLTRRPLHAAEKLISFEGDGSVEGDGLPRRSEHQAVHNCFEMNSALETAEGTTEQPAAHCWFDAMPGVGFRLCHKGVTFKMVIPTTK